MQKNSDLLDRMTEQGQTEIEDFTNRREKIFIESLDRLGKSQVKHSKVSYFAQVHCKNSILCYLDYKKLIIVNKLLTSNFMRI